jgi:hypothetical protein
MASLLNNASLLLNPAGSTIAYKEDKINSVLPNNGAGDFAFTGGNGGTRVNQEGYIEVTPANVVSYSSDLSNAYWTKRGFTQLSTTETAPDGSPTAYKVQENNTNNNPGVVVVSNITPVGTYTFYVWLKADANVSFALSTVGNVVGTTINVTTSWQLFQVTQTLSSPANGPHIGGFATIPQGSGIVLYIWHPQLNLGSTAKPYQPTTDRLNYPRITYQNGKGALMGEPQRTNKQTNSQEINNTDYSLNIQITISNNFGISPDGTQNADKIIATTTNDYHQIRTTKATPNGYDIISCFVKASGYSYVQLTSWANPTDFVNFNLENGTVGTVSVATIYGIEPYGNGWYRIWANVQGSGGGVVGIGIITSSTAGWAQSFAGNGTDGILVWGVQIEVGTFPTSYIPTTSATVTRPADVSYVNGISSIIGQTQGVLYAQVTPSQLVDGSYICISDNTTTNRLIFGFESGNQALRWYTPYGNSLGGTVIVGQQCKIAAAYNVNDFSIYLNGVQVGSYNSGQLSGTYSHLGLDSFTATSQTLKGTVNNVALFNTRLTNTQLAELTTVRSGSGGNISYYGPYTIHTFTGSATFTPSFNGEVEVLVVAGGGGGGGDNGGGGGAGGVIYLSSAGVSAGVGYTITIGSGGAGGTGTNGNGQRGASGSNTSAMGMTSIGGGGGGGGQSNATQKDGGNGGSGGGGGGTYPSNNNGGTPGNGILGQGFNGGNPAVSPETGGGGGGAGSAGIQPSSGVTPDGGVGLPFSINGFNTYYGGGGAGGTWNGGALPAQGFGGLGGGGNGGYGTTTTTRTGTNGVNYTGGGGGGAGEASTGGIGGSGIVIIRYLT